MDLDNGDDQADAGHMPRGKPKRDRGPTLPVLYVDQDQYDAIREGLPEPYSSSAKAVLLAAAGRVDLVPETQRAWVAGFLRDAVDALEE